MIRFMILLLAVGCLLTGISAVAADDAAKAVIGRAIKARGGEAALTKHKSLSWTTKGTYYGMGAGVPATVIYQMELPEKSRVEIEGFVTTVLNKDKGWFITGGQSVEMNAEQLDQTKKASHVGWVITLLPLKDPAFTLTTVAEEKVDNRPAVGVKVSHKDRPDVLLFFDKETGLLVKVRQKVQAFEMGNKEVDQETFFIDYKDVQGVKHPMKVKILREGSVYVEGENTEYEAVDKFDDGVFQG